MKINNNLRLEETMKNSLIKLGGTFHKINEEAWYMEMPVLYFKKKSFIVKFIYKLFNWSFFKEGWYKTIYIYNKLDPNSLTVTYKEVNEDGSDIESEIAYRDC